MTAEEFAKLFENWLESDAGPDEYDFWCNPDYYLDRPSEISFGVVVEVVDFVAGGEDVFGGGRGEIYVVFQVTSPSSTQYFKRVGEYASHQGSEWEDHYKEVLPHPQTVVVYE